MTDEELTKRKQSFEKEDLKKIKKAQLKLENLLTLLLSIQI